MKSTTRQEAIEFVARKVRSGWSVDEALAGDFLPHPDSPLGHITIYIDDLYNNGSTRQWRSFVNAVKREALRP